MEELTRKDRNSFRRAVTNGDGNYVELMKTAIREGNLQKLLIEGDTANNDIDGFQLTDDGNPQVTHNKSSNAAEDVNVAENVVFIEEVAGVSAIIISATFQLFPFHSFRQCHWSFLCVISKWCIHWMQECAEEYDKRPISSQGAVRSILGHSKVYLNQKLISKLIGIPSSQGLFGEPGPDDYNIERINWLIERSIEAIDASGLGPDELPGTSSQSVVEESLAQSNRDMAHSNRNMSASLLNETTINANQSKVMAGLCDDNQDLR